MYRKLKGEAIFDGTRFHYDKVLVMNGEFVEGLVDESEAGEFEKVQGVICPGFINCHCHLELSHLKGLIPEHTGLVDFVIEVMQKRFGYSENEMHVAMLDAIEEMGNDGIVAVGDISNTSVSLEIKQKSSLEWINFVEVSGIVAPVAEKRLAEAKKVYDIFIEHGMKAFLVPHAPYSVSPELFGLLNLPQNLASIHNQENRDEDKLFMEGTGDFIRLYQALGVEVNFNPTFNSSLKSWLPQLDKAERIISVHNTFTGTADIEFSSGRPGIYFCICINANRYIENAVPPVSSFPFDRIVIGTDSLASNHSLSIRRELHAIKDSFPGIEWETLLGWATINGARALGIDDRFGSFEKGKRPGIAFMDITV